MNEHAAINIITRKLDIWPEYCCLDLAIGSKQLDFVAHPLVQILFDKLWNGPIIQKITLFDFLIALLCPLYVMKFEYRNDKELLELSRMAKQCIIPLANWSFSSVFTYNRSANKNRTSESTAGKILRGSKTIPLQQIRQPNIHPPAKATRKEAPNLFSKFLHRIYLFHFKTPEVKFYWHLVRLFFLIREQQIIYSFVTFFIKMHNKIYETSISNIFFKYK